MSWIGIRLVAVMACLVILQAGSARLGMAWANEANADGPSSAERIPHAERLPNIVILLADDMGYGDLNAQNPESKIPTPHLDRLASQGIRFTDAHSSSGVCTPSRYALLMGRYHWRKFHGIVNSFEGSVLDPERVTLAELLRERGYRTACIGKWHLGWDWESIRKPGSKSIDAKTGYDSKDFDWTQRVPGGPLDHGFDIYFGDDVPNFPPYAWFENDRVSTPPGGPLATVGQPAEGQWETRPGPAVQGWDFWQVMPTLTDRAVAWISEQKPNEPFFLYFPFTSPHAPILPTEAYRQASNAGGYGDFMVQTDATVGRVMAALEQAGLDQNTLVLFSSDNGPEHYAYERVRRFGHRSTGTLRGVKRDLWEGGHRVPMIAQWPNVIPAGQVRTGLISQTDWYATLAAQVGVPIPARNAEDSLDQSAFFRGDAPSPRTTMVHNTNANGFAIRENEWVLIMAKSGGVTTVPPWYVQSQGYSSHSTPGELYDLSTDLGQRINRYSEFPERVQRMQLLLEQIRAAP